MRTLLMSVTLIFLMGTILSGRDYYVSTDGNDQGEGTLANPFQTIMKGISSLGPGDRLIVREGRYHEKIIVEDLHGTPENPIVITSFPGEEVLLDGTVAVAEISEEGWTLYEGNIYQIPLEEEIWQLIVDDKIQTSARWPNASWHDGTIWSQNYWACGGARDYIDKENNFVQISCNPLEPYLDLASSGLDVSGAMAILNIANYDTYCEEVLEHEAGSDQFKASYNRFQTYTHHPLENEDGTLVQIFNRYFFECKLDLLDAPSEWYYDRDAGMLYLWTEEGNTPMGRDVRGKTQSYFFDIQNSEHVRIKGFHFKGTTFSFIGCRSMLVEDCEFLFPSYSKRMLGQTDAPLCTRIWQTDRLQMSTEPSDCTVRNCTFMYADGDGISLEGSGNVIDNCLFYQIDYSCVDIASGGKQLQRPGNGGTVQAWYSPGITLRRVTVHTAGEAHGICGGRYNPSFPQDTNLIEYCLVTRSGLLHNQDGANFHLWQFNSDFTTLRYNWAWDSYKYGFRYDGDYAADGSRNDNCTMHHCVSWDRVKKNVLDAVGYKTRSENDFMIRGDRHRTSFITAFGRPENSVYIRSAEDGGNQHSSTFNNAGDWISGSRTGYSPINGDQGNNYNGYLEGNPVAGMLRDPKNHDFRPRQGSCLVDAGTEVPETGHVPFGAAPDVGAYEFGDTVYWIPGYQSSLAGMPIPADKGSTRQEFMDLIWLEGYLSIASEVYFGSTPDGVGDADRNSSEYMGRVYNNIFTPPPVDSGQTYYWRVDAVSEDTTLRGEMWSFTAQKGANSPSLRGSFTVYGNREDSLIALDSAFITINGLTVRTDSSGKASMIHLKEGTWQLKVSRKGYIGISDSIVLDSNLVRTDTLELAMYDLTVAVMDGTSGQVIRNAQVDLSGVSRITDSNGKVTYPQIEYNTFNLSVTAEGYLPLKDGSIAIFSDSIILVELYQKTFMLEFHILDCSDYEPVYRAYIQASEQSFLTDHSGAGIFESRDRSMLTYTIEHEDYFTYTDSLEVSADTVLILLLTPRMARVSFVVSDSQSPVYEAKTTIDHLEVETDQDGTAVFLSLPARQQYEYLVAKSGYTDYSGIFYLECDTVIGVTLELSAGVSGINDFPCLVYPNPADDLVNVEYEGTNARLRILDALGATLIEKEIFMGKSLIDIGHIPDGVYILFIHSQSLIKCIKLIVV